MNTKQIGPYAEAIRKLLCCTPDEAVMIKDIMRNDVLHTVALDWLSKQEFNIAAGKAGLLFVKNRALYEAHYAAVRAEFKRAKAAELRTA